jgi:hypothetical protein
MSIAFNKVTYSIVDTSTVSQLTPIEDWIVDPIFDDETRAHAIGPKFWVITGSNIHAMTDEEIDVDSDYLTQVKNEKIKSINDLRNQIFTGGFTDSNSIKWTTTPSDVANINAVCTLIALGVVTNDQTWRDYDNTDRTLTISQLIQLAAEMAVFGKTCYGVGWYHKSNVEALTSASDVLSYDYTTGWPS